MSKLPLPTTRWILALPLAFVALLPGCGGSDENPPVPPARVRPAAVEVVVRASDADAYEATVRFPEPTVIQREQGGVQYTELLFEGLETGTSLGGHDGVGLPAIPMLYRNLAVPIGATPRLVVLDVQTDVVAGVLLYPHQQAPVDGEMPPIPEGELPPPEVFGDHPFEIDEAAYEADATRPSAPADIVSIGSMRDLDLLQIQVAPMRYNAARRELTLQTEVTFRVEFPGNNGAFLPSQAADPFEAPNFAPLHRAAVLNGPLLYENLRWTPGVLERLGAELLILTPPDFLEEARDLAAWKREKGITTQVYRVDEAGVGGIGSSKEEIRDFIRERYEKASPRPSYVLLLGDAEFIPPFYRVSSGSDTTEPTSTTAS